MPFPLNIAYFFLRLKRPLIGQCGNQHACRCNAQNEPEQHIAVIPCLRGIALILIALRCSCCRNGSRSFRIAANHTLRVLRAGLGRRRFLIRYPNKGVARRFGIAIHIGIAADFTGMSRIALFRAGGLCYYWHIDMPFYRDFHGRAFRFGGGLASVRSYRFDGVFAGFRHSKLVASLAGQRLAVLIPLIGIGNSVQIMRRRRGKNRFRSYMRAIYIRRNGDIRRNKGLPRGKRLDKKSGPIIVPDLCEDERAQKLLAGIYLSYRAKEAKRRKEYRISSLQAVGDYCLDENAALL